MVEAMPRPRGLQASWQVNEPFVAAGAASTLPLSANGINTLRAAADSLAAIPTPLVCNNPDAATWMATASCSC